jgi:hypothetical protein
VNARTTRRLSFQPVPGVAQNTKGASIPAGTPLHYDGARLLASVDGQHDYGFNAPEQGDYEMDTQNPYATETTPTLKRHHWQALACLIQDHRPDWAVEDILTKLMLCKSLLPYPDLARTALIVAMDPASGTPAAIYFAALGVIAL